MSSSKKSASSSKRSKASSKQPIVEYVDLLWDINTCPLTYPYDNLVTNIEKALSQVHLKDPNAPIYRLSPIKFIVGNVDEKLTVDAKAWLNQQGFKLDNAEERNATCGLHHRDKPSSLSPELMLESYFIDAALYYNMVPDSRNIFLISSDYDFSYSLKKFLKNGYTVFLACDRVIDQTYPD
ncbi:unnamed protein product, partial [Arabidopsis halleri]